MPRELRERLRQRDRSALETFYEAYFDRVYGYVRRMLGDDSQAEDVTQEVFLSIQRSIDGYDPARPLSLWVFTIATNQVRDHWRASRRVDPLDGASLDEEDARPDPASREAGPLPALEQAELSATLSAAIDELPESLRTTLVLRYREGLSFEEIARMIARNETAVRKRYSRALEELRVRLGRHSAGIAGGGAA
ncbi:MAG: RNA polymerase sigma factor [Planctomycetes bacterium]|nr:RNA polymerase sigma factor [Planctomycetota bacterium]